MSHERLIASGVTMAGVITATAGLADMLFDMRFVRNEGNEIFALGLMVIGGMTAILSTAKVYLPENRHQSSGRFKKNFE